MPTLLTRHQQVPERVRARGNPTPQQPTVGTKRGQRVRAPRERLQDRVHEKHVHRDGVHPGNEPHRLLGVPVAHEGADQRGAHPLVGLHPEPVPRVDEAGERYVGRAVEAAEVEVVGVGVAGGGEGVAVGVEHEAVGAGLRPGVRDPGAPEGTHEVLEELGRGGGEPGLHVVVHAEHELGVGEGGAAVVGGGEHEFEHVLIGGGTEL